jgi:flavin reductase (DIM6/NTAB) family NADH-FMN oxidoreductase RutF
MSRWCTGVTVITARDTERAHGMVASSFTGVSIDPMTIMFCADRRTRTHAVVKAAGAFAVNILAADQDQTFRVFTGQQGNPDDRFADECTAVAITGAPILTNSLAWMDCRVVEEYAGGNSHTIFVGRVVAAGASDDTDRAPLLYFQRQVRALATPDV